MIDWEAWRSYRPASFLMFAPRIYWRLFESINLAWWPAALLLAVLLLAGLARRDPRLALGALAVAWALSGAAFLHARYAPIFWLAGGWAWAFGLQALVLLALAWRSGGAPLQPRPLAWALVAWGLAGHALLAPLAGRPWLQAELFGLAPDATALATLGVLAMRPPGARASRLAWLLPLAWCVFSAATRATLATSGG